MDTITKGILKQHPWTLLFADDVMLSSKYRDDVQTKYSLRRIGWSNIGLRLNVSKSEYMECGPRVEDGSVRIHGTKLNKVDCFKYLGCKVTSTGVRQRGRPRIRWLDRVKLDMIDACLCTADAMDRTKWKTRSRKAICLMLVGFMAVITSRTIKEDDQSHYYTSQATIESINYYYIGTLTHLIELAKALRFRPVTLQAPSKEGVKRDTKLVRHVTVDAVTGKQKQGCVVAARKRVEPERRALEKKKGGVVSYTIGSTFKIYKPFIFVCNVVKDGVFPKVDERSDEFPVDDGSGSSLCKPRGLPPSLCEKSQRRWFYSA
ncbi:hypothetical protein NECAME_09720 [Necator americanus]|uniref:Reverse transcriptase domain-containing protein n=1 Tax=Necator americanus TaxID=51031 RepID=W2TCM6_NECAM|nr:hypothetical protein NECAME_09720 [Necator americanus]ETN79603.1 hypothetical protein NECAME_09720 [Necator americanus]